MWPCTISEEQWLVNLWILIVFWVCYYSANECSISICPGGYWSRYSNLTIWNLFSRFNWNRCFLSMLIAFSEKKDVIVRRKRVHRMRRWGKDWREGVITSINPSRHCHLHPTYSIYPFPSDNNVFFSEKTLSEFKSNIYCSIEKCFHHRNSLLIQKSIGMHRIRIFRINSYPNFIVLEIQICSLLPLIC